MKKNTTINKPLISWVFIFILGIILGKYFLDINMFLGNQKEMSYKSNSMEPRYLKSFKRTDITIPEDKSRIINVPESKIEYLEKLLNNAAKNAQQMDFFKDIKNERVFLSVTDLANLAFTIEIDNGQYKVSRGHDLSDKPTMIIPLDIQNIESLDAIFADKKLTYAEQYGIYYLISIPALQSLYNSDALYTAGDKSILKFDNFVQFEIIPQNQISYKGNPVVIQATAVNVDGQWLVFRGFIGDPDWKLSLSLNQATKMYTLGVYDVKTAVNNPSKLLSVSSEFLKIVKDATIYSRSDHKN